VTRVIFRTPLNVFQRLCLSWDAVHPYNAAQACLFAGRFSESNLTDAWRATAGASDVTVLDGSEDLATYFTRELNARHDQPIRAFAQHVGNTTWFGITYQHSSADSFSVRMVLSQWLKRLLNPQATPHARISSPLKHRFLPGVPTMLGLLRDYSDYRRSQKVHTLGPLDYAVRVLLLDTPRSVLPGLLAYARSRRAKLNDVLLAALAESGNRLVPMQNRPGRPNLGISYVANLRPALPAAQREQFGCALGFGGLTCRPHELADWDRLLASIAARNRTRRRNLADSSTLWMLAAERATRNTPPDKLYDFYRKEAPFAGGLSNVNLNGTWFAEEHPQRVLDYVRISPTGPMVPVALNVTSLGENLSLSLTYRRELFNDWTAKELGESIVRRLTRIASGNV
jgi:hypothetical protein